MMFSKVLNYAAASSTAAAHSRFMGSSSAVVPSSASSSSSAFNYDNLRLDDILCPVCQSMLIEPVILPCNHLFCRNCIRGTFETNKMCCPCCRKRFASWYRNATRANELVHEQLWRAIQSQFAEHLDEDNPSSGSSKQSSTTQHAKPLYAAPPTSTVQLANPGEIGKEYKDELKRYQKEIFEEKAKELTASEQYIINLYKQEGIIDLADNSSHVSVSSATTPELHDGVGGEKCSTDAHASTSTDAVAGPSSMNTHRTQADVKQPLTQNGLKVSGSFNHNSPSTGSIISISSTSSAASGVTASSCATSSASGRYSLIKSVAQKVGRSAEIVKQKVQDTFLHRLTAGKLQQHQRSLNAIDLNKSELCVKPTAVHRQERRGVEGEDAESDETDSLKSEQNHFIPIVQSMPKSSFSCNTFRRVPTVRPVPSPAKYESSPKKSPYQPLNKHNRLPSAFKVVNLALLSPPPVPCVEPGNQSPPAAALTSSKKKESPPKTARRSRGRPRRIAFSPAKGQKTSPKQSTKKDDPAGTSANGRTKRAVVRPTTIKDIIVSDQQRREQQIEMERRDFEFAQKLQQKLNRASGVMQEIHRQPGAVPRCTGYSLRRRGSSNNSFTSGNDSSTLLSHSNDNTPSSSGKPANKATAQATRKRKATSSSVENDVPSSSSPPKRVAPPMKTRRQTKQWRLKTEHDSSLAEGMEPGPDESSLQVTPVRKSTRNKTR